MVKRRDLVKELVDAGFINKGGTNHEVFIKPGFRTTVPRHREIDEKPCASNQKASGTTITKLR